MIVPASRLLVCYGVVIPALALLPLFCAAGWPVSIAAMSAFAAVAFLDCVLAIAGARHLSLDLPAVIRMTKGRESSIGITVHGGNGRQGTIRLGLPLPGRAFDSLESLALAWPAGRPSAPGVWPCKPLARGRFIVDGCYVETSSPLGLWHVRRHHGKTCEVRVYPNLMEEGKQVASLFLNRGGPGLHAQRQQGRGREFERLREYAPGDSYDEVNWKATAKRHHPISKVFRVERTQEIYVCVDASRLSGRTWPGATGMPPGNTPTGISETYLDRFIGSSLVLGLAARKQGDLFGLCAFDEGVRTFVRAAASASQNAACRERLVHLNPAPVNPDFDELFTFVRLKLRRRALVIVLTSLDDPLLAEQFARAVEPVRRDHLVLAMMFRPAGARPVFSNPGLSSLEEMYDELAGHSVWWALRELQATLGSRGVELSLVESDRLCPALVSRYMAVKQRQVL